MKRRPTIIEPSLIKEWFEYESGTLVWKIQRGSMASPGKEFGTPCNGSRQGSIQGERFYIANVVWCWHHGVWPQNIGMYVDHIDRNRMNNSIENLRLLSMSDNFKNSERFDKIVYGKPVTTTKRQETMAIFRYSGFEIILGSYPTKDQARFVEIGATRCIEYLRSQCLLP